MATIYVLVRNSDGYYVAPDGSESSYCRNLQDAKFFSTLEAAEKERCVESERVLKIVPHK